MAVCVNDYVDYLAVSHVNHTQTYMGEHHNRISHDQLNRFMRATKISPRQFRQEALPHVTPHENGLLLFDDTTLNKEYSEHIELAQTQYSGAKHGLVTGIHIVTCVYVNPDSGDHWLIDYRIYNPESDGKTKIDHLIDMLDHTITYKKLPFRYVLFDSWYAINRILKHIDALGKIYYCPVKSNRNVHDGNRWQKPADLTWSVNDLSHGRECFLKDNSRKIKIRMFRVERCTRSDDTSYEYIVTNDTAADDTSAVADRVGARWKIEELHREVKQTTAIERCQCRKARAQRNHIACAFMAWVKLKNAAKTLNTTIYQIKQRMLDNYMAFMLNTNVSLLGNR